MFAFCRNTIWRGFENLEDFPACEVFLFLRQSHTDSFARQPKRDENRTSVGQTPHCLSTVGQFFDDQIVLRITSEVH